MTAASTYTVFWLFKMLQPWQRALANLVDGTNDFARQEYVEVLERHSETASLRAAYSAAGYRHDVDMILWLVADDPDDLQRLAVDLNRTKLGQALEMRFSYLGVAAASQYDKEHGPAFMKGIPPRRYLSVYPFTKTPEWYILPFPERLDMMKIHGQLGDEFPTILTNTVSSFGIQDQEFIVALEDDDPAVLVRMVQRLRGAEVRKYTQLDTPIFLGQKKPLDEVLSDLG
jgi:hydrogen peroxide-dependent heme synthase